MIDGVVKSLHLLRCGVWPGMDDATSKKIVEPFFTTKPVGIGTGPGLSVSYFIITENHKGTIDVESQIEIGTRFIIRLPV